MTTLRQAAGAWNVAGSLIENRVADNALESASGTVSSQTLSGVCQMRSTAEYAVGMGIGFMLGAMVALASVLWVLT